MSQQFPPQYSGNLPPYSHQPQYPQQPMQEQPPFQQYPQQPPPGYYPPQGPYAPQQSPKKSHKGLWIALAAFLVVLIATCSIVGMAANGASKSAATTTNIGTSAQPTTDTSSSSSSSSGNTVVNLGKPIVVDDVSCTATSAKVLPAGQYDQPKQGQEYVVVHVKMSNGGQSDQTYNPYDFHAKSGAGNVTDNTFTTSYTANNALDAGTMAPGGKVEGDLVFQVPVGDSKVELTWTPSFFNTSTQYAWKLNIK
jgi:Domain of unknown function (DUF4352)